MVLVYQIYFFLVRVGDEVWGEGKGCKRKSWSDQPVVWVGVSKKGREGNLMCLWDLSDLQILG